ncbi:MAG TPA: nuclear transport factor 2 family protein [Thermoanaerobaculia bacterium]
MRKAGLGILVVVAAMACNPQTGTVEPIVIDLSHREPSATATPSPTPAPTRTPAQALRAEPSPAAAAPTTASVAPPTPLPATAAPVPAPAAAGSPAVSAAGPEQIVDRQLDAFNRHDLEAFVATYAPGAILYDHPDKVRQSGAAEIRKTYGTLFGGNPALQVTVSSRILQGPFVVDHETVTGITGSPPSTQIVIYEVWDGKITRLWILK